MYQQRTPESTQWTFNQDVSGEDNYLATPTQFARRMELLGYGGTEGNDDSALRKRLYPDILQNVIAMKNALAEE